MQGCSLDEVAAAVITAGGPVDNGTKAEAVKWHDDKVRLRCWPASSHHGVLVPVITMG